MVWKVQKAIYGLMTAPQAWRLYFADTMSALGAKRLRSEPNVDDFPGKDLYNTPCVGDILAVGPQDPRTDSVGKFRSYL